MKILIVNDDSISAPGIEMLARMAASLGEVTVVAPAEQCSAMSQRLTIRGELRVRKVPFPVPVKAAWQVSGTPVDCVKVALHYILEEKPDWVFSGINNGYNAGFDIPYSGTLGAAFEAARNGIPAIAFSAANNIWLPLAEPYLLCVARELMDQTLEPLWVWNVNFPSGKNGPVKGILRDRCAAQVPMYIEEYAAEAREDGSVVLTTRGKPASDEEIPPGTDAKAVREGYISIGKVRAF